MSDALVKLFEFIKEVWEHITFWTVLKQEHLGFVRRLGVPHRLLKPGLNWRWPLIEEADKVDARTYAFICDPQSLTTADGVQIIVRVKVSYAVVDPIKAYIEVADFSNQLQDIAAGELSALVRHVAAEDVFNGKLLASVSKKVKRTGRRWGIKVWDVELADYVRAPTVRLVNSNWNSSGQE